MRETLRGSQYSLQISGYQLRRTIYQSVWDTDKRISWRGNEGNLLDYITGSNSRTYQDKNGNPAGGETNNAFPGTEMSDLSDDVEITKSWGEDTKDMRQKQHTNLLPGIKMNNTLGSSWSEDGKWFNWY